MRSRVRKMVRIEPWLCVVCFYLFVFWYRSHFCPRQQVCDYITFLTLLFLFGPFCTCLLHLHYRTPFRHSPPLCYFSPASLSSTEDQQDKMHQGFYLGNQLAMKTFATVSTTKWNPVELYLTLQTRNPFLDPSRLHKIPHIESLTMCLTHRIAREPVKPP